MKTLYTVYNREDCVACIGNARECQKFIGSRSLNSFFSTVSRQASGLRDRTRDGYVIMKLEDGDDDPD